MRPQLHLSAVQMTNTTTSPQLQTHLFAFVDSSGASRSLPISFFFLWEKNLIGPWSHPGLFYCRSLFRCLGTGEPGAAYRHQQVGRTPPVRHMQFSIATGVHRWASATVSQTLAVTPAAAAHVPHFPLVSDRQKERSTCTGQKYCTVVQWRCTLQCMMQKE